MTPVVRLLWVSRVLVTLADATTALLQQGQVVWRRSEALSCVLASRFLVRMSSRSVGFAASDHCDLTCHIAAPTLTEPVESCTELTQDGPGLCREQ